jgi:hypothetical protein
LSSIMAYRHAGLGRAVIVSGRHRRSTETRLMVRTRRRRCWATCRAGAAVMR